MRVNNYVAKIETYFAIVTAWAISPQELSETRLAVQQWEQRARQAGRQLQQLEEGRERQGQQLGETQAALQQAVRYVTALIQLLLTALVGGMSS